MTNGAFVIVAPNSMAFRAISNSDVLPLLQQQIEQQAYDKIIVLSPNDGSQQQLPDYIEWRDFLLPAGHSATLPLPKKILRALTIRFSRWCGFGYENTVFRFNQLQQFFAHQFKQGMNQERRLREELAGNYVSKSYGFPFPNSRKLYAYIYAFFYSKKHIVDPNIAAFFENTQIGKLVFWHVQSAVFREYSIAARRLNIPYLGVIGSWDRPTTKGPVCPGCERFIVNSQVMQQELVTHHGINKEKIAVVGWPQMDIYHDTSLRLNRSDFLESIGINPQKTVLLYAGNAARLGAHEPSVVGHIAEQINQGKYGDNVHLLIRPHPQDVDWQSRYAHVNAQSQFAHCVTLMPAEMANIQTMINTLSHAEIVLATQGSISLDAAALDKKIINIAFDGNLTKSYTESVKRWYEMDHYVPVVESGGVAICHNFTELDQTIQTLLQGDGYEAGRQQLRTLELEPFNGDSSARQVQAMLS